MIAVVGVPVDGVLGPEAQRAVDEADLLVGGSRLLEAHARPGQEVWDLTGRLAQLPALLERNADRRVVVLASGDPLFFGIGGWLARKVGAGIRFLPAPSSVAEAAARLGLPWSDHEVISVHGRPMADIVRALDRRGRVALLTDARNSPAAIGRLLAAAGRTEGTAHLAEALGTPDERVRTLPLSELAEVEAHPLNVLFLEAPPRPRSVLPHLPEEVFARRKPLAGLITKREVRTLALALLGLRPGDTCWDVGAGSGSVGIEMALLGAGRVFAVERNPESCRHVRANAARLGLPVADGPAADARGAPLEVVEGRAPEALEGLPDPDRVFVGGSGGRLEAVLDLCFRRLAPAGRVVVAAATVETLHRALAACRAAGHDPDLVQVQVSRGRTVGGRLTRLAALNPVWLVAAGPAEGAPGAWAPRWDDGEPHAPGGAPGAAQEEAEP